MTCSSPSTMITNIKLLEKSNRIPTLNVFQVVNFILLFLAKKNEQNLIYPDTAESAKMVTMVLTKTSNMKYQKVRNYLENKTLEELQNLRTANDKSSDKNGVLLSTLKDYRKGIQGDRNKTPNKTQETDFGDDPIYQSTAELGFPDNEPELVKKPQKQGIIPKYEVGNIVDSSIYSTKSKVILTFN
jgi:hypothetical protein